ncbi:MAG: hypothetical protein V4760_03015 [Bdellovibrionota bacterium]
MTALLARTPERGPQNLTLPSEGPHNGWMPTSYGLLRWLLPIALLVVSISSAEAKTKIVTLGDGVIVYSGPGEFYRPLAVLPAKSELRAGNKPVSSKNGAFYKVLVKINEAKNAIGYVSLKADIRTVDDTLGEDDLEKYGEIALVNRALQLSYTALADRNYLYTVGYMKFLSPGFYFKGFAGQFSATNASATVAGGEVGNDALLFGPFSGVVNYAAGLFAPSSEGAIFQASSGMNAMMQAGFGLRLNMRGVASLSAQATQFVAFNANNSFVSSGGMVTLEVGL